MSFPFSVLRMKKQKHIKIISNKKDTYGNRNLENEFNKHLNEIISNGLYFTQSQVNFLREKKEKFYHNNIAILLLSMNLISNNNFKNDMPDEYKAYKDYISRINSKQNTGHGKAETFDNKLDISIEAYTKKINSVNSQNN